ncbi:MAG: LysR family transcriptional regulator [Alphaproteobacteria bacterium]|jgi:DNA-binding transcriptional LysR family regulator|nr:LysR family transcriptional regulator [Alphaproteobacteria bacterium]MBT5390370.1 LysR family transcriptional regulator [Alphaproteobacteria bacterium]
MDWDKIRVFYRIAKSGSFTSAAEQMEVTQSALSRQISALEYRLKSKLFKRHSRGLVLTKEGEALYHSAQIMHSEFELAESLIREDQTDPFGPLTIGLASSIRSCVMGKIDDFINQHTNIQLKIVNCDKSSELALRSVDAALIPSIESKRGFFQSPIVSSQLKLYTSPKYLEKFGTPKHPEDLECHRLISRGGYMDPSSKLNWFLSIGTKNGKSRQPFLLVNSETSLFQLAEKGLGIISLCQSNFRLQGSNLVEILPHVSGPKIDFNFVYPHHLMYSKAVLAFGNFLKEVFDSTQAISDKEKPLHGLG